MPQYILERATVKETGLPAKQIARFYRVGVGTLPLRKRVLDVIGSIIVSKTVCRGSSPLGHSKNLYWLVAQLVRVDVLYT